MSGLLSRPPDARLLLAPPLAAGMFTFEGVITSAYRFYQLRLAGVFSAVDDSNLRLQFGTAGGGYSAVSHETCGQNIAPNGSLTAFNVTNGLGFQLNRNGSSTGVGTVATEGASGVVEFVVTPLVQASWTLSVRSAFPDLRGNWGFGYFNVANVDRVRLRSGAGADALAGGVVALYGWR